jgi:DnaJ like chaperone protein
MSKRRRRRLLGPGLTVSIWTRIAEALAALSAGEGLAAVFDRLRTQPERSVGFTIAVIALGAKMAKADGRVTRDEVTAFREVFHIPVEDEASAARVFNLARQDTAGFEDYARRIGAMFEDGEAALCDLIEGLFHIAVADGRYHPAEDDFLHRVARIFGLPERDFRAVRARFVPDAEPDPRDVLGLPPGASLEEARAAWRRLVRETHPDRMIARGVPAEAVRLAEKRLVAINRAWDEISGSAP